LVSSKTKKKLLIGVDEAGYGPNLGPLLVGGSAWLVPPELDEINFSNALSTVFQTSAWKAGCQHVPLGDSKKLYSSSSGIKSLEIGLLTMLRSLGLDFHNLELFLGMLARSKVAIETNPPWYQTLTSIHVPSDPTYCTEIQRLSEMTLAALRPHGIELVACRANVITEPEFNRGVAQCDSKGRVLSTATLDLVSQLLKSEGWHTAEIFCDRQGGRKNYLPLLLEWMPDSWFVEAGQSAERCSYRTNAVPELTIHFTIGGDSFPPTALASMIAKYLRERLMEAFNEYWVEQCPGLKPTAGYPQDAQRFRKSIEQLAERNALPLESWWRQR
jgi:ribonuclease HII